MNVRYLSCTLLFSVLFMGAAGARAAAPVLAEGLGIAITVDDLNADAQRMPASMRPRALAQPDAVQQAASNLFVLRALADEAEKAGLAKDPVMMASLRLARDRILSEAMLARMDAASTPSDEAVEAAARAAYNADPGKFRTGEQIHARHILIAGNNEKAKEKAEKVLADLKAGADFEKTAKEFSDDPGSASRGGDLGFFEQGRMVPEFEQALSELKNPGDLSGLVRTQFGWHIVKLEGRRPAGVRSYDEVRDQLRQSVINQLKMEQRQKEASRLAASAKFNREAIEAFSAPYQAQTK